MKTDSDSNDINFQYCSKSHHKKYLDRSQPTSHVICMFVSWVKLRVSIARRIYRPLTNQDYGCIDEEWFANNLQQAPQTVGCIFLSHEVYMENLEGSERVMVISPHPDDVDFGCSGTIAKWSRAGMDITYVICTSGDKGMDLPMEPESIAAIREKEQVAAAEIVGVQKVVFLRLKDGELENNREFREMLVRVLRQYRPNVVVSMDPANLSFENVYVNHTDHRAAGLAVFDAVYPAARNRNFFPKLLEEGLSPHAVDKIFFFGTAEPNTWIDIGETIEAKIEALGAHQSQVGEFEDLSAWVRERFGQLGKEKGLAYAEAFRQLIIP